MATTTIPARNRRVGMIAAVFALAMLGLGFAAVPLYRMFCQATGYGGTTQRVSEALAETVIPTTRTIRVRFDGNVDRDLPWHFRPEQVVETVPLGGRRLALFIARNDSNRPITGQASFNVEPEQAGIYFNKIQCFCFTQQTLAAGQQVSMPVIFYVDPKIADDPDAKDVGEITLSYTFHEIKDAPLGGGAPGPKPLDRPGGAG